MNFLVDNNVLAEPTGRQPNPRVIAWLHEHQSNLYTSAIVIGEIQYGIERLAAGPKRRQLEHWLKGLIRKMDGRILAVNHRVALEWARLIREMERKGRPMPLADSLIAATARRYGLALATDNTKDFDQTGLKLVNPFM